MVKLKNAGNENLNITRHRKGKINGRISGKG